MTIATRAGVEMGCVPLEHPIDPLACVGVACLVEIELGEKELRVGIVGID